MSRSEDTKQGEDFHHALTEKHDKKKSEQLNKSQNAESKVMIQFHLH